MCVGLSRRICQRWVCRYNEAGLAGLNDLRGQQAAAVLTVEQEARMRSVWRPVPRLQIGSVRGGASTCSAFWPKNSASGVPCQRCMGDCIDWGTPISVPDHAIAALIRRCKPLFGALCPDAWPRLPRPIPAHSCACSTKTKRGSANRERPPTSGPPPGAGLRPFGRPSTSTCGCWEPCAPIPARPKACSVPV